jgi:RNA polymerase sigma factor (sigma-70 family)
MLAAQGLSPPRTSFSDHSPLVRIAPDRLSSAMSQFKTNPLGPDVHIDRHFDLLLQQVGQNRDRDAFIEIFNYFAPRLKSFLMKNGTPAEQAEELMQETMIGIWTRAESYDPDMARASTWIFTIARNKKIDAFRKVSRIEYDRNDPAFIPDDDIATADDLMMDSTRAEKIAEILKTLPEEQASLIKKSFFEDKTHMEIARENGLPLGTVKSRIRLALERLRGQLGREYL